MINLLCTVRNCHKALQRAEKIFVCPLGHSFDISSRGYVNLLQPQDKRSLNPGDSKQAVVARHRLLMSGQDNRVADKIVEIIKDFNFENFPKILDVGCGEGFYLNSIMNKYSAYASGLDISVEAIDLASRYYKNATWIVTNADRFLPYPDKEFNIVMSITARKNPSEFKRVLLPEGYLLIVVPAPDDLIELRESIMEKGVLRDRSENTLELFNRDFVFLNLSTVKYQQHLNKDLLNDLLLTTYRGARHREKEKFDKLEEMTITFSRQIFCFRPK